MVLAYQILQRLEDRLGLCTASGSHEVQNHAPVVQAAVGDAGRVEAASHHGEEDVPLRKHLAAAVYLELVELVVVGLRLEDRLERRAP